jgi:hypothetical protein
MRIYIDRTETVATTHPDDRDEESIIRLYGNINVHIVIPT